MSYPQPAHIPPMPPAPPNYQRTSHLFHLVLCGVTFGLWLLVWPFVAIRNASHNRREQQQYERAQAAYDQAMRQRYGGGYGPPQQWHP